MHIFVSPTDAVNFSVWGADGTVLKSYDAEPVDWQGPLPTTQDYFIHLISIPDTNYTVTVTIPPLSPEPSIEVLSPNGGEQWQEGDLYDIVWASSGVAVVDIAVASGGKDLGLIASGVDATRGRHTWGISSGLVSGLGIVRSDDMRIRISDRSDPALYDENDAPFSVLVTRIRFAPGTTSATVSGYVQRNSAYRYVLRAIGGQMMEVTTASPGSDVNLTILGLDGTLLKSYSDGRSNWQGELPSTQDYFLEAIAMGDGTTFQLTVSIAPQETEPVRIQFAPGATSATLSSHVAEGNIDRYVLRALAEQTAEVVITAPGPDVVLDLMGADGTVLQHHTSGIKQWAGRLPSTQDYFLSVVSVGQSTAYELMVRIEPRDATPTRIYFEPGTTGATLSGSLPRNGSKIYVLRALGGQTMNVAVISPGSSVGLSIWGADGQFLKWHGDGVHDWSGLLPATSDYYLEVITVEPSSYALTVDIPPL
jgi:hypothetical protein